MAARLRAGHGDQAELNRLANLESKLYRDLEITKKREAGSEIHAIFLRSTKDDGAHGRCKGVAVRA